MKKTNKVNPLKFFNDNKAAASKKAGKEMSAYKKSLKKAQYGGPEDNPYKSYVGKPSWSLAEGPLEKEDAEKLNSKYPGTSAPLVYTNDELNKMAKTYGSSSSRPPLAIESDLRKMDEQEIRANVWDGFNRGRYTKWTPKKMGGSVKRKKK
jgi:hypothetical protein